MLEELRVQSLLLIEQAELRLERGLNVLTGETGAGKTVLAHALDLLLGGRARPGIVRPGASEAYVEGTFELSEELRAALGERLAADAAEVVLARRVGADGRTRAYLNGRSVSVGDLRDAGGALLTFYGQHEHRKLTLSAAQMQILDGLCGPEQAVRLQRCAAALEQLRGLERRLDELRELADARERELDLLEHELAEIDSLAPREGEHERLLRARERLRRLDALRAAAGGAAEALAPETAEGASATQLIADSLARVQAVAGVDDRLDTLSERMSGLLIESQDLAAELRDYGDRAAAGDLEDDQADLAGESLTLDALEARLATIERLARKHGGTVTTVLEYADAARARRAELVGAEVALAQTSEQLGRVRVTLDERVSDLRRSRKAAAKRLARGVREQLASLAMGEATFEVNLSEREPGPGGGDAAEFLIAPNPGVPAGPLREIASGGELSRVMLAIMSAAGAGSAATTLVFDEVDAGIGGHTARAVGARLRDLARHRQLLCITHLPQIASLGDRHFTIVKDTAADPTLATVVQLEEPDVVAELVRMLGADGDDMAARRHARELRRAA
jgi:DNA repair protein RecN (Recombination protein N)